MSRSLTLVFNSADATRGKWTVFDEGGCKCEYMCDCTWRMEPKCSDGSDPLSSDFWAYPLLELDTEPDHTAYNDSQEECDAFVDEDNGVGDTKCATACNAMEFGLDDSATMTCCLPTSDSGGVVDEPSGGETPRPMAPPRRARAAARRRATRRRAARRRADHRRPDRPEARRLRGAKRDRRRRRGALPAVHVVGGTVVWGSPWSTTDLRWSSCRPS